MKKQTILKFLKYLGVACIGAFVGMGALIGVSSCSSRSKNDAPIVEKQKHYKLITPSVDNPLSKDEGAIYYIVAKKYSSNGEGVFYQDSINLTNSAITSSASPTAFATFEIINQSHNIRTEMHFYSQLSGGVYHLSQVWLSNSANSDLFIYQAYSSSGSFDRRFCAFTMTNFTATQGGTAPFYSYLNQFFDVYSLGSQTFQFSDHINYYAPYGQDIDSYYVNDASMVNPSDYAVKTILNNRPFYSGGMAFDTIQLRYQNAMATSYLDENGNRKVWTNSGFACFMFMEYVNSATNYIIVVNDRILSPWQDGNNSGFNITKNSKWLSEYYRDITFFDDVPQTTITNISVLNNSSYDGGYIDNSNIDNVGLSNVFDLLRLAFTSWIPIFNIQIIPGITIGLMMFLPLITGVILFIVWLVKR